MAIGDRSDVIVRLKRMLPPWFGGDSPILDAVLTGLAHNLAWGHDLLRFAKRQMRRLTAEEGYLDLLGWDFFGARFQRRKNETDDSWRGRILPEILRERGTRGGIVQAVKDLTGNTPVVLEFTNGRDCGSYGGPWIGYGYAGAYGSIDAHTQLFLTAIRPKTTGIPDLAGYGSTVAPPGYSLSGYGVYGKYASLSEIVGAVTDADIYRMVADTQAAGVICWTSIVNVIPDPAIRLDFSNPANSQYLL